MKKTLKRITAIAMVLAIMFALAPSASAATKSFSGVKIGIHSCRGSLTFAREKHEVTAEMWVGEAIGGGIALPLTNCEVAGAIVRDGVYILTLYAQGEKYCKTTSSYDDPADYMVCNYIFCGKVIKTLTVY